MHYGLSLNPTLGTKWGVVLLQGYFKGLLPSQCPFFSFHHSGRKPVRSIVPRVYIFPSPALLFKRQTA